MLLRAIISLLLLAFASADACHRPPGIEALEAPDVIVIGEYHSTNEIPPFFFDVVCTLAKDVDGVLIIGLSPAAQRD